MIYGLALCAGAGGLELGLQLALGPAYTAAAFVEGEAYAAACLVARQAEGRLDAAPIWDDLRTFDGLPWRGRVDLVSPGFPCQPASLAGKRAGGEDERWLWPHVARIVEAVEPAIVFFENVPGLRSIGAVHDDPATAGLLFGEVLADLAGLGYVGAWGSVRAADAGAPHRVTNGRGGRERVFLGRSRAGQQGAWAR